MSIIESKLYGGRVEAKLNEDTHYYGVRIDGGKSKRPRSVTAISGIVDKADAISNWKLEVASRNLFAILQSGRPITDADIVLAVYAADEEKDKAADLGTAIHAWCEAYINAKLGLGAEPDMPEVEAVALGATAFMEWEAQHHVQFLWTEKLLYSLGLDYCGKADFAAIVDARRDLCDIKSGNGLYNGVRTQTAGYVIADEEETGEKWQGRWAIRLAKETAEDYAVRMELKNRIRRLLGKEPLQERPYQVFEAIDLDMDPGHMQRDKDAFVHALHLSNWHNKTRNDVSV